MMTPSKLVVDGRSQDLSRQPLTELPTQLQPEKRLMLAVLEGAVRDFQTYATASSGRGRRIFLETDAWLRASGAGPFTFETICQATGLDPEFVRGGLRRWYSGRHQQRTVLRPAVRAVA